MIYVEQWLIVVICLLLLVLVWIRKVADIGWWCVGVIVILNVIGCIVGVVGAIVGIAVVV